MANYEIRPLQLKLLEIALAIHKVCEEHNLRYYLVDGSLIGAVRHKGFIPWDDDMDICMPRPDYDKLIEHPEWLPEQYEFVCYENDKNYPFSFGKIQDANTTIIERPHMYYLGGAYCDIFPIDGAPDGKLRQKLFNMKYKFLRKVLYFWFRDPYKHGHGPSCWLPLLVRKIWSFEEAQAKIKRHMMKYTFDDSDTVAVNLEDGTKSMVSKADVLGSPTPVEFEGHQLMGLKDNDAYLTKLFGDYMTPPPASGQHQHNFHFLDLNLPYRQYKEDK